MTQEDKELLLKDLCGRLPYGVIIKHKDEHGRSLDARLIGYNGDWFNYYIDDLCFHLKIHEFKPYLRPMSSMTEDEKKEYAKVIVKSQDCSLENSESATTMANDWLLSKGFDVRGLIPKGLALVAPDGMYK